MLTGSGAGRCRDDQRNRPARQRAAGRPKKARSPSAPASSVSSSRSANRDIVDVPEEVQKDLEILAVSKMDELLPVVLTMPLPEISSMRRRRHPSCASATPGQLASPYIVGHRGAGPDTLPRQRLEVPDAHGDTSPVSINLTRKLPPAPL